MGLGACSDEGHGYGESVAGEQDYCDWCYRPIESEDRRRSRELGLDEEKSFACRSCIDAGRIYRPPEGWEGEPGTWPVKDIGDLVGLVRENVQVVLGDVERTTGLHASVTVDTYMNSVRISYGSSYTTPSVLAASNPDALAETADYLQSHVVEDIWSAWPLCPIHDKGLYAEVRAGVAVWWCRFAAHRVAAVGSLGVRDA